MFLFDYSPETGLFIRKVRTAMKSKVGEVAGGPQKHGHIGIRIDGRRYLAHRLAWLYVYGKLPEGEIDHINGDGGDNRLCNLRECSHLENAKNRATSSNNTTGYKGVYKLPNNRWRAVICSNGCFISLGCFASSAEAAAAYDSAAIKYHGQFARTNQSLR